MEDLPVSPGEGVDERRDVLAKTLTSTLTLSQDVDLNGDGDVDSTLDLAR
jgi:hypothetical protein